jgi:NMD protein affecting ribosome stability and mRNA decay
MKIMKIDVCNYEDNLFDDKSIIVNCTLDLDNDSEYKIKVMIDNDCIDYSFIDINIAHKMCELLNIALLKLNKSREVKNYDDKRSKDITHVIYSFMIIQNHIESSTSMNNDSEYKIKVIIDNDCIDYSFIDINIAHKMCELLSIALLKLNKSREVKNYDDKRSKDITHVIYSFTIIQNHIESSTFMMIIKLDQHLIILKKS